MILPFPDRSTPLTLSSDRFPLDAKTISLVQRCLFLVGASFETPTPDFDDGLSAGIDHFFATVTPETVVTLSYLVDLVLGNMDRVGHAELMDYYASMGLPTVDFSFRLGFIAGWITSATECQKIPSLPAGASSPVPPPVQPFRRSRPARRRPGSSSRKGEC